METKRINKGKVKGLSKLKGYNFDDTYVGDDEGNVYKVKEDLGNAYMVTLMSPFHTRDGYVEYVLTDKSGSKKHINAHRVVAGLFLKGDSTKFDVNHKDGNRSNNKVSNLEYTTHSDNIKHSYKMRSKK